MTGVLLAFASGALISALTFELFEEAFAMAGGWHAGLGLLVGAAAFVNADTLLDKYVSGRSGAQSFHLGRLRGPTRCRRGARPGDRRRTQ